MTSFRFRSSPELFDFIYGRTFNRVSVSQTSHDRLAFNLFSNPIVTGFLSSRCQLLIIEFTLNQNRSLIEGV
jgi:hypothetical protein